MERGLIGKGRGVKKNVNKKDEIQIARQPQDVKAAIKILMPRWAKDE